jgi:hypothetical protein
MMIRALLLAALLSACGGSHSDTQRDQQGNVVIDQGKKEVTK